MKEMCYIISRKTARLFLLRKQMLLPPHTLSGKSGIAKVFKVLRAIQYDPLNPCGRNPDLVLQARVKNIHPEAYYDWLYKERKGIEHYDKELCIIPIEDLKYCRQWYASNDGTRTGAFLREHRQELNQLLKRIKQKGQLSSLYLQDKRRVDIWWGETQWGKSALDSLWRAGKLVISERKNGRKYYHLPECVYGSRARMPNKFTGKRFAEEQVVRRINSVGMLPMSGAGAGWLGRGTGLQIVPLIKKLLKKKLLVEVAVQGIKQHYVISVKDKVLLKQASRLIIKNPNIVFLAPLDNLLWDRKMIKDLFGFEYIWEVYTPLPKRKHGYYVLPILYGDKFIGRLEPVKKENTLLIKGFWLEQGIKWDKKLGQAFASALKGFKKYCQTKSIKWECKRPR